MKKVSWFAFFLILTVSCLEDPDCFQLQNNIIGVTFRVIGTGQGDSVLLKGFGASGEDAVITSFSYELNYFEEQAILGFSGIKGDNYISLGYTVRNQFVSEDCGSRFVLSDLKILEYDFDSARVVNATPTPKGAPNIDIYRCPATDTLTINFSQLYATSNGITVSNPTSTFISHPFKVTSNSIEVFSGTAATLHLPVDLSKDTSKFLFYHDEIKDSIVVGYDRTTERRYRPCGIQTFVNELRIINNSFDSISFALNADEEPQRTLLDPNTTNLRVYDCPKMNLLQVNFKSSTGAAKEVSILSVTADHISGNLEGPATVSTLTLPVDTESNVSNFYIEYEDRTDTFSVSYNRIPFELFNACGPQMLIRGLSTNFPNAIVPAAGTSLQFPTIPNVEITVN